MKNTILILSFVLTNSVASSQEHFTIPANTGYATPAEEGNENDGSILFTPKNGLQNWTNAKQDVDYFFKLRSRGTLILSLYVKNEYAGNILSAIIAGKIFTVAVPTSTVYKLVKIGTVFIKDTGFYSLRLLPITKKGLTIADIKSIELSGPAVANMHFNSKPRRNAASVHLMYPLHDSIKAISFYTEITVPEGSDQLHSYFMACGFARGYLGMQVISPTERRIIFSVWDAGNE